MLSRSNTNHCGGGQGLVLKLYQLSQKIVINELFMIVLVLPVSI